MLYDCYFLKKGSMHDAGKLPVIWEQWCVSSLAPCCTQPVIPPIRHMFLARTHCRLRHSREEPPTEEEQQKLLQDEGIMKLRVQQVLPRLPALPSLPAYSNLKMSILQTPPTTTNAHRGPLEPNQLEEKDARRRLQELAERRLRGEEPEVSHTPPVEHMFSQMSEQARASEARGGYVDR